MLLTDPTGRCIPYLEKDCVPVWELGQGPNLADAGGRLWHTFENVGIVGAIIGNQINAWSGHPSHEAERIASEDPIAAALGGTYTMVATAGLPLLSGSTTARALSNLALLNGGAGELGSITGQYISTPNHIINWGDVGLAGTVSSVMTNFAPWVAPYTKNYGRFGTLFNSLGAALHSGVSNLPPT